MNILPQVTGVSIVHDEDRMRERAPPRRFREATTAPANPRTRAQGRETALIFHSLTQDEGDPAGIASENRKTVRSEGGVHKQAARSSSKVRPQ